MALSIKKNPYETFVVLSVSGKVDPQNVKDLEESIKDALSGRQASLVFDFSGLEFIISSGMGCLLMGRNLASEKGGTILISGVRSDVYRVFDLLDFPAFFKFHPTVDAAIGELLAAAK